MTQSTKGQPRHFETGNFVRQARLKLPIDPVTREPVSQSRIAKTIPYKNGQSISNIERGLAPVPRKHLDSFAAALCVNPEDIIKKMVSDYDRHLRSFLRVGQVHACIAGKMLTFEKDGRGIINDIA